MGPVSCRYRKKVEARQRQPRSDFPTGFFVAISHRENGSVPRVRIAIGSTPDTFNATDQPSSGENTHVGDGRMHAHRVNARNRQPIGSRLNDRSIGHSRAQASNLRSEYRHGWPSWSSVLLLGMHLDRYATDSEERARMRATCSGVARSRLPGYDVYPC